MNSIVQRINELRTKAGMSQNELAQKIGVSANTVYHWNKTDAMPTLSTVERICEVFGISVEQFFHGLGTSSTDSDALKFLMEWRALSALEKSAVHQVIAAFEAIR